MRNNKNSQRIKKLVAIAVFSALAYVSTVLCKFIPDVAGFLSIEIKDAIIVICALAFGPLAGLAIAIIVPLIECFTISSTMWYGLVMNVLSSVTFVLVAGIIYKYKRSFSGAILGLIAAVFSVTSVMLLANLFITPLYLKYIGAPMPNDVFLKMIPTVFLPFNLVKATINGALVLILYKPVSRVLKKSGLIEQPFAVESHKPAFSKKTVIAYVIATVLIVASFCVAFFVLN